MVRTGFPVLALIAAVMLVACGETSSGESAEEELRSTERGFEYDCALRGERTILESNSTTVVLTDGHLRWNDASGRTLGARDKSYKAPKGTSRVRYEGFETGDDCELKAVADESLVKGSPHGQLRLQCAGDGFLQDLLECSSPKPTTLKLDKPDPPKPPPSPAPPASAKKWSCATPTEHAMLGKSLTMQVVDGSIRLASDETEVTGTRDREFKARSGSWMGYDDVGFGGDCSMTLIVDANALATSTPTPQTTLKVRCAGDGFQEDRYACKR